MTKQALRRKKRIDEILASAIAAFRRDGYHGTSMEQIADQLLMTKGSLYYYFEDKEEILFAAHDRALDRILGDLEEVRRRGGCACEQLENLATAHIRIMVEGFHGTALALEFGALSPKRLQRIVSKRDAYEAGVRALIERGEREGCFRPVDPKMSSMALLGAINWLARWYRPGGAMGAEEISRRFLDLFLGGLGPRPVSWDRGRHKRTAAAARSLPAGTIAAAGRRRS